MEVISSELQAKETLSNNHDIVLVPTMGNLHKGHISLICEAKRLGKTIVASIFINPLQFGKNEDFDNYPRTLSADLKKLELAGCDYVFNPSGNILKNIVEHKASDLSNKMCGKTRPGHFDGVVTIVGKLFDIIKPQHAIFGLKDYQQFLIIKKFVTQNHLDIKITGSPIIRERDGLAMSSRNNLLTPEERSIAPIIYKKLLWIKDNIKNLPKESIIEDSFNFFSSKGLIAEYLTICDPETLAEANNYDGSVLIAIAIKLGNVRLIDNILID